MALARFRFYGRGVPASEFSARPGPSGAIVIVGRDARLAGVDADALAARGKVLLRSSDLSILRLTTDPAAEDAAP
jgi:hypothetical protein